MGTNPELEICPPPAAHAASSPAAQNRSIRRWDETPTRSRSAEGAGYRLDPYPPFGAVTRSRSVRTSLAHNRMICIPVNIWQRRLCRQVVGLAAWSPQGHRERCAGGDPADGPALRHVGYFGTGVSICWTGEQPLRSGGQSQVTIRSMLVAMSQKPRIRHPMTITRSVWVSIQVLNLARNAWLLPGLKTA